MFFFCLRISPRYHTAFGCHVSLGLVVTVFQTFLIFNWQFWEELVRDLVGCPSAGSSLMFFLWLDWLMGFGEEIHSGQMLFLSHQIKCKCYQYNLSLLMLTVITWFEVVVFKFSTIKLLFFLLSFQTSLLGRKSLRTAHA